MNTTVLRSFGWEIVGSLLLAVPSAGLAESPIGGSWYVEAGIVNADSSRAVSNFVVDDEESGWSFGAGYAFTENLALQATYHALGKDHFATDCPPPNVCLIENVDRVDIDGYSLSAVGRLPLSSRWDVYGRLGVISWDSDFQQFARDESGEDLLYGVGIGLNISPKWRVSVQYEAFGFDVDTAGIGVTHRFGGS